MYKFFVNSEQIVNNEIRIVGEDVNHIKNVLRLKIGEEICVCDRTVASSFSCKILSLNNDEVRCEKLGEVFETTEAKTYIHILQGLPKADKLEFIIEKCTEIGVKEITPVVMKRTIVKVDEKDKAKKLTRWNKIAEVAAKQSGRDEILKVNGIINFKNIFEIIKEYDIVLIAYEKENNNTLKDALTNINKINQPLRIAVLIGPEGGIDDDEINQLCDYKIVTLGKRILRTETAPLVIASNILYELED